MTSATTGPLTKMILSASGSEEENDWSPISSFIGLGLYLKAILGGFEVQDFDLGGFGSRDGTRSRSRSLTVEALDLI